MDHRPSPARTDIKSCRSCHRAYPQAPFSAQPCQLWDDAESQIQTSLNCLPFRSEIALNRSPHVNRAVLRPTGRVVIGIRNQKERKEYIHWKMTEQDLNAISIRGFPTAGHRSNASHNICAMARNHVQGSYTFMAISKQWQLRRPWFVNSALE